MPVFKTQISSTVRRQAEALQRQYVDVNDLDVMLSAAGAQGHTDLVKFLSGPNGRVAYRMGQNMAILPSTSLKNPVQPETPVSSVADPQASVATDPLIDAFFGAL